MGKVYGEVLAIKGEEGKKFAQVISQNEKDKDTKYIVFVGDLQGNIKSNGAGTLIVVGDRISVSGNIDDQGVMASLDIAPLVYRTVAKPQGGGYKKRNIGMEVGHAQNGAFILGGGAFDLELTPLYAEVVADVTQKLKVDYATQNPSMDDYSVGAAVGCAVLNACRVMQSLDQCGEIQLLSLDKKMLTSCMEDGTIDILTAITTKITEYVTSN